MAGTLGAGELFGAIPSLALEGQSNSDKYPVFQKLKSIEEGDVRKWWNKLSLVERVDVGGAAIHFGYMTPNARYDVHSDYDNLSTTNRKRVFKTAKRKDDQAYMIDPYSLCGCA